MRSSGIDGPMVIDTAPSRAAAVRSAAARSLQPRGVVAAGEADCDVVEKHWPEGKIRPHMTRRIGSDHGSDVRDRSI